MKALIPILALTSLVATADPATIHKTETPIAIDGKLDEAAWQQAVKIPVHFYDQKNGPGKNETNPATMQYCWDANYLYIAYETFDVSLIAGVSGPPQGPEGNQRQPAQINPNEMEGVDVVEFFITFGDDHFFWELHHNAANNFSDVWCVTAEKDWPINKTKAFSYGIHFGFEQYVDDYQDGSTLKTAVTLKPKADGKPSTINDPSDVDTGYTAELRLPIGSIAVPAKAEIFEKYVDETGKNRRRSVGFDLDKLPIRILAVVQDMGSGRRYHHSSPTRPGGWFHHTAKDWNPFVFAE